MVLHPIHIQYLLNPYRPPLCFAHPTCRLVSSPRSSRSFYTQTPQITEPPSRIQETHQSSTFNTQRLDEAKDLYSRLKTEGLEPGIVLESALIDLLMKSGQVSAAFNVFDEMTERNVVTWTSMISGCTRNGYQETGFSLFVEMLGADIIPNDFTINAAIQCCADVAALGLGKQLHSLIVRTGLEGNCRTVNFLINFYARCGMMDESVRVFDGMVERDLVSFTSLMSGFCRNNMFEQAVRVFDQMIRQGLQPNEHTITSILTACSLRLGEQIHGYMVKFMVLQSVYSGSALLEFYSRHYKIEQAKLLFEGLEAKNVVTWTSMISCCVQNEQVEDALKIFTAMVSAGIETNEFTFATAIGACGLHSCYMTLGRQLHCSVIKLNLVSNNHVSNALLTMYARNGEIEEFEKVFDRMTDPDIVSWCSVISAYFQHGLDERSMRLLYEMHRIGYTPNEYGFSSALGSCANLTLLDQGKQFHCLALKSGCDLDVCTGNALVNMYAKCGCIDDARLAFEVMPTQDLMSWNSMIHGYAHHGHGRKALEVFNEMVKSKDIMPDHSTFIGILVGCSHVGCVDEAIRYFWMMSDHYGVVPSASHYACMIDMMGRAGRFGEALDIIVNMPYEPDVVIWKILLGSCRLHRNLELGKLAADKVIELSPKDSASYVLLSNLHAMNGEWDGADRVRRIMEDEGLKKDAGWSWIENKSGVHAFVASNKSHPQAETIYSMVEVLILAMKDEGYSPDISHL